MCRRDKLKSVEDNRAKFEFTTIQELEGKKESLEDSMSDALMDLQQSQYGTASYTVDNLLKKEKPHLEHDDLEFNNLVYKQVFEDVKDLIDNIKQEFERL